LWHKLVKKNEIANHLFNFNKVSRTFRSRPLSSAWLELGSCCSKINSKEGFPEAISFFAPSNVIESEVAKVLNSFGQPHNDAKTLGSTHIFNLGHGISQFTNPDSVTILAKTVIEHSTLLRGS
jgi:hypothetical protein